MSGCRRRRSLFRAEGGRLVFGKYRAHFEVDELGEDCSMLVLFQAKAVR